MKSPNLPVNILDAQAIKNLEEHPEKTRWLYRDELAARLGVAPKERLTLTVVNQGSLVLVSCLLDGGDLTPSQEAVFKAFLTERGGFDAFLGSFPEKPVTS